MRPLLGLRRAPTFPSHGTTDYLKSTLRTRFSVIFNEEKCVGKLGTRPLPSTGDTQRDLNVERQEMKGFCGSRQLSR